ncbi:MULTISPECIES: flagellar biosynthesis protein FlhF [unclassified Paenibacillus]|uniref:flagellar biosynthesis protein FlhF n=1 Tax=unclassified Paenibacillus TaxID=185978 RepID=UPI001AE364DE|nr:MULTISPECIES: flagellar biosynthesis protein FlhF [unclassified Paenibacillus]MBP1155990.1 flagellar biosynthesis protein FlhF [Paenibacillus sp. PvP091]MBP1168624.1 flagellar biosynthesis protein FlhF [Paenibacillus sp. PvR098]MBP2439652.1 flagellar biosynthesis protein FlhF [Paenibacillus sp. PvP052]
MRVKRYVVDSMPDALQKIRTDLGKDAVIINTKEIRSGGFLGMFSKKKIEVIAATDTATPGGGASAPQSSVSVSATVPKQDLTTVPTLPMKFGAAAYGAQRERQEQPPLSFPEVPDVLPPTVDPVSAATTSPAGFAKVKAREDILMDEIKQMKELMLKLSQHGSVEVAVDPVLQELEARLLCQEVDPILVQELLANVSDEAAAEELALTEEWAFLSLKRQLEEILRTPNHKGIAADTRIAHFVGPTGVGKTTTIAKLAAEQVLKHHRKVGFITSDTYRIAAVEQLKTYATILNVPLEVVFSPLDLNKAFEQLKECDLIFMDTAGRNFRNEMYVSELNALLKSSGKSETYLVLSMTTKYRDMQAITNNFCKFKLDKVLFTKMDETDSYGSVVNLIREFGLQTSYVANGQSVPDDIQELNEQQLIDQILGAGKS